MSKGVGRKLPTANTSQQISGRWVASPEPKMGPRPILEPKPDFSQICAKTSTFAQNPGFGHIWTPDFREKKGSKKGSKISMSQGETVFLTLFLCTFSLFFSAPVGMLTKGSILVHKKSTPFFGKMCSFPEETDIGFQKTCRLLAGHLHGNGLREWLIRSIWDPKWCQNRLFVVLATT